MAAGTGMYAELVERGRSAFRIGLAAYLMGALLYYAVGLATGMNARWGRSAGDLDDDLWPVQKCLYAAGITFTTVGFTDLLGTDRVRILEDPATGAIYAENSAAGIVPAPGGEPPADPDSLRVLADYSIWTTLTTVLLCFVGMGVFVYVIGAITAFFTEGAYRELREVRRALRVAGHLRDHVVVCGAGATGFHVAARLESSGTALIVVDDDEEALAHLRRRYPAIPCLRADPTEVDALETAGVARCTTVIAALEDDNDNLVTLVTARELRADVRLLAQAFDTARVDRLRHIGAETVIVPPRLGGMRIASEAVRPTVVEMLDEFLGHERERSGVRFWGVAVPEGSPVHGLSLGAARFFEETGVRVLAVRNPGEKSFVYNPLPETPLAVGATVGFIGDDGAADAVRRLLARAPGRGAEGGAA